MFRGRWVTRGLNHPFSGISGFACKVKAGRSRLSKMLLCGLLPRFCLVA
jgi:hypothetical protein